MGFQSPWASATSDLRAYHTTTWKDSGGKRVSMGPTECQEGGGILALNLLPSLVECVSVTVRLDRQRGGSSRAQLAFPLGLLVTAHRQLGREVQPQAGRRGIFEPDMGALGMEGGLESGG